MNDTTANERLPRGVRLLHALQQEPDLSTMTAAEFAAYCEATTRKYGSPLIRSITGFPDRGAEIRWQDLTLADRVVRVRVYRLASARDTGAALSLVLHVHGGGFVGTASQCDWGNAHLAARLPALVVSVEHRLLTPETPLADAVADAWDVLRHLLAHATEWGFDPARVAVAGESAGGLIAALIAIRARAAGLPLRAQVLINPACDLTDTIYDYPSMTRHAYDVPRLRMFRRLAVPPGSDPRALSPLHADLGGLAAALVVVPTVDPLADHGRSYAERLRESGTPARLTEYPGAPHAFITLPRLVPQAKAARAEVTEFLRGQLAGSPAATTQPPELRRQGAR
jgi:acetyl esterase